MKLLRIAGLNIILLVVFVFSESFFHLSGGLNLSSMSDVDVDSVNAVSESRKSFNLGIGFEQNFSDHFSFLTGFSFEPRGERETQNITRQLTDTTKLTREINEKVNMFYLQIPLIAQFNLPVKSILNISAFAGPDLGVAISAEREIETKTTPPTGEVVTKNDTINFANELLMLDFGIRVGIGCEIRIGSGALFIRPDFYIGMLDFIDPEKSEVEDKYLKGKHRNIRINLGYKFGVKNKVKSSEIQDSGFESEATKSDLETGVKSDINSEKVTDEKIDIEKDEDIGIESDESAIEAEQPSEEKETESSDSEKEDWPF